jgi:hypothetical protein
VRDAVSRIREVGQETVKKLSNLKQAADKAKPPVKNLNVPINVVQKGTAPDEQRCCAVRESCHKIVQDGWHTVLKGCQIGWQSLMLKTATTLSLMLRHVQPYVVACVQYHGMDPYCP